MIFFQPKAIIGILLGSIYSISAQIGGNGLYNILKIPASARQAALGGNTVAFADRNTGLLNLNPALANEEMHQRIFSNINTYLKEGYVGNAGYAHLLKNGLYVFGNAAYIDYGKMKAYDESGDPLGEFSASDAQFLIGASKQIKPRFTVGASMKVMYSSLSSYISNGFALDIGSHYLHKDSAWSFGLVLKNIGMVLTPYAGKSREPLPFEIIAGASIKPKHMPARFHLALGNLQKYDITYDQYVPSSSYDLSTGKPQMAQEATFLKKGFRHFSVGTELVFGKYFQLMIGYNAQRRFELAPEVRKGVAGFSWGANFRVSKIQISYASIAFFPGFNMNLFTFSTRISDFKRKS